MAENLRTADYRQQDSDYAVSVMFERHTTAELTAMTASKTLNMGMLYYDTTASGWKIGTDAGTLLQFALQGFVINGTPIGTNTPSTGNFNTVTLNSTLITANGGRVVNTTAALASLTLSTGAQTTYIATPAAAITLTLPAVADGFRCRIVFGAATTVTWASTVAAGTKTVFAAGESYELVYNAVAGTPANSAATTWYPF